MINIYETCPMLENKDFTLRFVDEKDAKDLLEVYCDKKALPFFNSDNCNGDNFYYKTEERVLEAIQYWQCEYRGQGFVRFSIIDKKIKKAIGTIELFHRKADDYFNDCGILRLDVRSDYEKLEVLENILSVIMESAFELFDYPMIATKAAGYAVERIKALKKCGFKKSEENLTGQHDNRRYYDYWVIRRN